MNTTAADIAAAIRRDLPGIGRNRLHKLLYLAQGHHLGTFARPLFDDPISAWDNGPVVATLWQQEQTGQRVGEPRGLTAGELTTVGQICARYGNLSRIDLETLTKNQDPYRQANQGRRPGEATRIDPASMATYFATVDVDDDEPPIDAEWLKGFLARAAENADKPAQLDNVDDLLAKYGRQQPVAEAG